MTLDRRANEFARRSERLSPYGLRLVERAADVSLFLHASEVGVEHLLCALMQDDDCAAHRAVLHAFADPETIEHEARATADGILVVGSLCTLPFSMLGVRALFAARELAPDREVAPVELARAACAHLSPEILADLSAAGSTLEASGPTAQGPIAFAGAPLFKAFGTDAKRVLSNAARAAHQAQERSISPAQVLLAALHFAPAAADHLGISVHRARVAFRGRTADETPLEPRTLAIDARLAGFLDRLGAAARSAGSLELLANYHAPETAELAQLLARNKVTRALLERSSSAFQDPIPD